MGKRKIVGITYSIKMKKGHCRVDKNLNGVTKVHGLAVDIVVATQSPVAVQYSWPLPQKMDKENNNCLDKIDLIRCRKTEPTVMTHFCRSILFLAGCCLLAKPAHSTPQEVHTGVYLMNLYDLNLDEHSFFADFYIWFKWKGNIDPTEFEFVNAVEKWGMTIEPFEDSILTLKEGWQYQGFRVEGRFFQPFLLDRFPVDRHQLEIHIENPDYPIDALVYLPDSAQTGPAYRPELLLGGWNITGTDLRPTRHAYLSDFGNPDNPASTFSDLVFSFQLARPVSYFLLKLLLPLSIVLVAALSALLFFPSYVDARVSLPVGSLLTAVFLQQGYADALPDIGYMVLMDLIYLLAYAIILGVMVQIIFTGNKYRRLQKKNLNLPRIRRKERRMAFLLAGLYMFGILLLVWLA